MDSQTWDPHFPAGQHFSVGNTAVQKKNSCFSALCFHQLYGFGLSLFKSGEKQGEN